jgi:hypothetical protein
VGIEIIVAVALLVKTQKQAHKEMKLHSEKNYPEPKLRVVCSRLALLVQPGAFLPPEKIRAVPVPAL